MYTNFRNNAVTIREAVPRKSENFMNGQPDFISLIQNYILGNAVKMRQEIHNSSLILSTKVKVIISRETDFRKVAKAAALKI